jgi:superfamily I DNA/RNA helicase
VETKIESNFASFDNLIIGDEESPLVSDFLLCLCCEYLISFKGYHEGNDFYKVIRSRFSSRNCLPQYLFSKIQKSGDLDEFLSKLPAFDVNGVFDDVGVLKAFMAVSRWEFDGANNTFTIGGVKYTWKSIFLRPFRKEDGSLVAAVYYGNGGRPVWESIGFSEILADAQTYQFDEEKITLHKENEAVVMSKEDFFNSCKDLKETDAEQREAISAGLDKDLLILAGAGSGKTRCLVSRVAYLNLVLGVPLNRMVLLTFTRNVAFEMSSRSTELINNSIDYSKINPGVNPSVQTQTIDAFFRNLALTFYEDVGFKEKPTFGDEFNDVERKRQIVGEIIRDNGLLPLFSNDAEYALRSENDSERVPSDFLLRELDNIICGLSDSASGKYQMLEGYYMAWQLKHSMPLDFPSTTYLIREALKSKNGTLKGKITNKYRCILIDEFQDISILQNSAFSALFGSSINFTFVGDDDQTIYGWRGSDNAIIDGMAKDSKIRTIALTTNYRSDPNIVKAGNAILNIIRGRAKSVPMKTKAETGNLITVAPYNDKYEQLIAEVLRLLKSGTKAEDILILSRANPFRDNRADSSPALYSILKSSAVPVRKPASEVVLDGNYYIFKSICQVLCGLPIVAPIGTLRAILGIDYKTTDKMLQEVILGQAEVPSSIPYLGPLSANIRDSGSFCQKFCDVIERYAYAVDEITGEEFGEIDDPVFETLRESALNYAVEWQPAATNLKKFFETFEKDAKKTERNTIVKKDKLEGVQVNSIHAAKGLEAQVVFIVGCENHAGSSQSAKAIQKRIQEAQNAQGRLNALEATISENEFDLAMKECETAGFDPSEKNAMAKLKAEVAPFKRPFLSLQPNALENYIHCYRRVVVGISDRTDLAVEKAKAAYVSAKEEADSLQKQRIIAQTSNADLSDDQKKNLEAAQALSSECEAVVDNLQARKLAFAAGTNSLRELFKKANIASGLRFDLYNESVIDKLQNELDLQIAKEANEERRVFYVALTRAKKKLYLMYNQAAKPSDFVDLIPPELVVRSRILTIAEQEEIDRRVKEIDKKADEDPDGGKTTTEDVAIDLTNADLNNSLKGVIAAFDNNHPLCMKLTGEARTFYEAAIKIDTFNKLSNTKEAIIAVCICLERSAVSFLSQSLCHGAQRFYSKDEKQIHEISLDLSSVKTTDVIPPESYVRDLLTPGKKMRGCEPMDTLKGISISAFIALSGYPFVPRAISDSWNQPASWSSIDAVDHFVSSCLILANCRNKVAHPDESEFWSDTLSTAYTSYYGIIKSILG